MTNRPTLMVVAFTLIALFLLASPATAQWFNVRGTVYESSTLTGLPGASVLVNDSTGKQVAGRQTTQSGQFLIPGIPAGNYTLKVSYMGFKTQSFALNLKGKGGNKKVNDILMKEDATLMQEAVVTGKLAEMTVVDDTVMYNAAAFSLPPGSMVEELIKRLPGIVIDENGKITHNGKEVKQILVDGKEFFGRDQQLVLQNIPAEIVDKVKAYDKQSDLARITGIDDGEEQTVLDLEIKKDKRRGWFGRGTAGYGTEERYTSHADIYRFLDKQKAGVVGNANNTQGNGMQANQDAAASLNLEWDKFELNGGLTGRFNQSSGASWSNSQNFENANAAYSNRSNNNSSHSNSFATNWRFEWKPDTLTNILIRPQFNINGNRSHSNSESATFNDNPYSLTDDPLGAFGRGSLAATDPLRALTVNHNLNGNRNASDAISGSLSLQVNRRLQKPGRNITFNINGGLNQNDGNSSSYSQIDYYQILALTGGDSIYHKIQYDDSRNVSRNLSARLSYTEPIATGQFLQFSYNYSYRYNDRDRSVSSIFDPDVALAFLGIDNYDGHLGLATPDTAQCNYTENHYQNHDLRLQYRFIDSKVRLNIGFNVQPQVNSVDYTKGWKHYDVSRTVVNWSPTLNFRYRFTRQHQIQARYGGQSGQPSITDLIPDTLSNANPLAIRLGNPDLKPSFTHNARVEWRLSQPDYQRSYNFNANFRTTQNSTASRTEYNEVTGGRITMPVNINGNWNAGTNFNFNTALKDQRFRINSSTSFNHTTSKGFVYRSAEHATVGLTTNGNHFNEGLRFTFRDDFDTRTLYDEDSEDGESYYKNTLEVNLHGNFGYNATRSTSTAATDLDIYNFSYGLSANWNFWFGLNLSTDINQQSRRGYADDIMNTNQWIWNAQATYSFLSRRQAIITLRWNDILQQRDMVNRNVSATSRTDSDSERVVSYAMLSFTYRFNMFGGRNVGGKRDRDNDDEGGRGRGGDSDGGGNRGGGNRGGGGFGGPGGGGGGGRF
ncbi:MAG: TonB-dependent receptor [Bacteroidaceae bacterium]|nr:TonB-dependent receptor [Bacteroidaceae bacterium]